MSAYVTYLQQARTHLSLGKDARQPLDRGVWSELPSLCWRAASPLRSFSYRIELSVGTTFATLLIASPARPNCAGMPAFATYNRPFVSSRSHRPRSPAPPAPSPARAGYRSPTCSTTGRPRSYRGRPSPTRVHLALSSTNRIRAFS